jgi:hypothetical protein
MAVTRTIHVSRNGPEVPLWKIATSQLTWLCSRPIRKESRLLAADRDREVGISSRNQALTRWAFVGHYNHFMMVFASHRQPVCLLLGLFRLACAFGMAQVGTLFLLLWRDWRGDFTGRHGIATHRILESGR